MAVVARPAANRPESQPSIKLNGGLIRLANVENRVIAAQPGIPEDVKKKLFCRLPVF